MSRAAIFQQTNYSGAGSGGDHVLAEAQDGGGTNNANFRHRLRGSNGRMQMYNWTAGSPTAMATVFPTTAWWRMNTGTASRSGSPAGQQLQLPQQR
ncbi:MAG: M36 family metallopeptidase [Flavobacteriales bacterium]|nr:M36 family metallopeptidase [Flavobacteriales bacterium]